MLEQIDLSRKVSKDEYKEAKEPLEIRLGSLQRQVKDLGIPVAVVFEGWDAAGKGTLINDLILPLDPRGFSVHSALEPNEEEAHRPFLWRFATRTPSRGRMAIFDRSWYRHVLNDRVDGRRSGQDLQAAFEDIRNFERVQADDGAVIVKVFLHITKQEQARRFKKIQANPITAWRVTEGDLKRHKQYKSYLKAVEDMISETDVESAPWTVVEAHDRRFACLKIFNTVINAIERRVQEVQNTSPPGPSPATAAEALPAELKTSILDSVDLSAELDRDSYRKRLKKGQKLLRDLEHEMYMHRVPVVIVYEGWDAAGKGGNIRRMTQNLDPRGYEVVPIGPPNADEKAHHYLWRFWREVPKAGHLTVFDRSWYGRVLVERVEGFASENQWRRAFREINEFEQHLANFGAVVLKFWLHIDPDEQLRRFDQRQETPHKRWKITEEDWRNREKWPQYKAAVEEMLFRTSTPHAPWTVVESNCKWFARVKTIETVCQAIQKQIKAAKNK